MDPSMYTTQQEDQECILGDTPNTIQHPLSNISGRPAQANTFVHKLYNMVLDVQFQHLIAWNYMGASFIVCNIVEFSRAVLPKHFKHNNFSSFVRQLNIAYATTTEHSGFHKLNKSPRGHRTLAENQIWEFSHPSFLRGRPDLLDEIKRKVAENPESARPRDTSDMQSHLSMIQAAHSDMLERIDSLMGSCSDLAKELAEAKRQQASQDQLMKGMLRYIVRQNQAATDEKTTPSIFVTSPDAPMTLQTQQFNNSIFALSRTILSDDESSLYSPHSPHTPTSHSSSHVAHNYQHQHQYHRHSYDPLTHRTTSSNPMAEPGSVSASGSSSMNNVEFTFVVDPLMEPLLRR
ncbi:HSF-type DNA-binding-domain-containing protein [Dichotomocladium elegans]|nr:HSF-type DNA-binding-domain-containing protein [Dichotomocladium elegans]